MKLSELILESDETQLGAELAKAIKAEFGEEGDVNEVITTVGILSWALASNTVLDILGKYAAKGFKKLGLEKTADKHDSPFTWIKDMPLTELEKPEMIIKVKEHHAKQLAKLKLNKNKKHQNNPFLKGEDINVEENLALDDVSSSCLICHK